MNRYAILASKIHGYLKFKLKLLAQYAFSRPFGDSCDYNLRVIEEREL